ncbi:MAG: hypothetical protein KDI36_09820 [Pseudomonadales bacterium]|nr:hypothetical protein [Pseudomonadales bacterium]
MSDYLMHLPERPALTTMNNGMDTGIRVSEVTSAVRKFSALLLTSLALSSAPALQAAPQALTDLLTQADECLYMLESTRDPAQPECDSIRTWYRESYPKTMAESGIADQTALKDIAAVVQDIEAWYQRHQPQDQ